MRKSLGHLLHRGLSMGVAPNLGFDFEIYLPCMCTPK
jgi:hypothetical protein